MKFLVDRCAGARLAEWLSLKGHDSIYAPSLGPDPGDEALLRVAHQHERILITIDKDFGTLVYTQGQPHCGIVRLPDVSAERRISLVETLLRDHPQDLHDRAIITIRGARIRVSRLDSA